MAIKGKSIIITGASSGIGAATTRLLAREGARLVIVARRKERLEALKAELPEAEIIVVEADVTDYEGLKRAADEAISAYGRIDAIYNNAGIMPINALSKLKRDEWEQMLNVNVMGVLNGIAAVLPTMIEQKSGHILVTDSVLGHVVVPNLAVYSATKFALRAIMEGLRQEQHSNGIKTSLISPGVVHTEIYASTSDADHRQEQVARAIAFAIDAPEDVDVNEVIMRPLAQPM